MPLKVTIYKEFVLRGLQSTEDGWRKAFDGKCENVVGLLESDVRVFLEDMCDVRSMIRSVEWVAPEEGLEADAAPNFIEKGEDR